MICGDMPKGKRISGGLVLARHWRDAMRCCDVLSLRTHSPPGARIFFMNQPPPDQPRNPLHGLTLEAIVTALVAHYGWEGLGERIPVRCFQSEPSVKSSLAFLRRTPWAREKVESLYLFMLREQHRNCLLYTSPS